VRGRVRQSSRLQNKFDFSRFLRLSIFSILGPSEQKKALAYTALRKTEKIDSLDFSEARSQSGRMRVVDQFGR